MTSEEIKNKNKKGIANILNLIAICLIIGGCIAVIFNIQNWSKAFIMCLSGTTLSFVARYIEYGYIKFFN